MYQKGLSFTFVAVLIVLLLYNYSRVEIINAQWIEINDLVNDSSKTSSPSIQSVRIKIGNRIKLIPVTEILWIEADDYCVKLHTGDKTYSLRKSLKSLESELSEFNFVRCHRSAIVNINHIDHFDVNLSLIILENNTEVPVSQKGAQTLRNLIKAKAI